MAITSQTDPLDTLKFLANFVGDPDGYKAKYEELKALETSTKTFIEAVAPTNEILSLRDETKFINEKAKQALKDAKVKAEALLLDASNKALVITGDADTQRVNILRELNAKEEELRQQDKALQTQVQALSAAIAQLETDKSSLAKAKAEFEAVQQQNYNAYVKSKQEFEAAKSAVLQKHEQFIGSLKSINVDEG